MQQFTRQEKLKHLFGFPVIIASLGYFVDIYDLLLFGIVRIPSLKDLNLDADTVGTMIIKFQMIGLVLGGIVWGIFGDRKGILVLSEIFWIFSLSLLLALTPPARIIIRAHLCSVALWSFFERISVTTSSNSYAICIFFAIVSHSGVFFSISICRFTALLRPENEKSSESLSSITSGNIHWYSHLYWVARSAIFFHPGKPISIIFDTLSKHSPAASSCVCPIISRWNNDCQR